MLIEAKKSGQEAAFFACIGALLAKSYETTCRVCEFLRVVTDAVFEDDLNFFDVIDVLGRVTIDDDEVCLLSFCDCADAIQLAQKLSTVRSRNMDGFQWCESGFNKKFD